MMSARSFKFHGWFARYVDSQMKTDYRGMRSAGVMAALLAGLPCLFAAGQGMDAGRVIDVSDRPQLFIDGLFFASSRNVALHVVPAVKTGERTLVSDRPWEDATLNWFSVMDDGGKYRMWYECYDVAGWPTAEDTSFCYAESADGIHWNRPSLGLFPYHGSSENNILFRQIGPEGARSRVHGAGVFPDLNAAPEERYKAVSQGMFAGLEPPYRVARMSSPDGLHWTRLARPICEVFADSQYSGFWDAQAGQYVLYGRVSGRGRAIGRAASPAFDHFEPLTLVLQTDDLDPPESDLYNPTACKYPYADRVALFDAKGTPLDGCTMEACIPITGDHPEATLRWNSGAELANIPGQPLKLAVKMRNASLFGFRFADKKPSKN